MIADSVGDINQETNNPQSVDNLSTYTVNIYQ